MSVAELQAEVALPVKAALGEGPLWDAATATLLFVDIEGDTVHRFDPSIGNATSFATGVHVGTVGLAVDGSLVLALVDRFARCGAGGEELTVVEGFATDVTAVRFNDGKVDPWGRFVAGTMEWKATDPVGGLFRLDAAGRVEELVGGVTISNGLDWTADRRSMYYIDTPTHGIDVFTVDPDDGSLHGRRRSITLDPDRHGMPDGMTLDSQGCLWVACYWGAKVCRFTPDGVLDTVVHLPASCVTSVTFGGERLDQLYITTAFTDLDGDRRRAEPLAGHLFVVEPGVSGVPPHRFG